ncbi:MAG: septum formation inhibitor Maf [Bacteroidetes bacterium]|nr:MAG: septum formation inhibitor Maf [Bacteroidota bacterium]
MKNLLLLPLLLILFQACAQKADKPSNEKVNLKLNEQFGDYWYQGKAELTSYDLEQVRYGEKREGEAVLIFVTEDFSKSKQVKLDNPKEAGNDAEKVLKLNFTKKFNTGIYPYSIMSSVFSPVYPENDLHARKITTSVQEWCGHVFMQLNNKGKDYNLLARSYFESEGDVEMKLDKVWMEDELWTLLRLDPNQIPEGEIKLFPSTQYLRLKHKELKSYTATISFNKNDDLNELIIEIPDLDRELSIFYKAQHPYQIEKWEETYPENGKMMTTTATLKERIMLDYWNRNSVKDSTYRDKLKLGF